MIPDILYWMAVAASMTLSFLIVRLLHATPVALALLLLLAVVPKLSILVLTLIYVYSARKLKAAGIQVGLRGVKTAQVP